MRHYHFCLLKLKYGNGKRLQVPQIFHCFAMACFAVTVPFLLITKFFYYAKQEINRLDWVGNQNQLQSITDGTSYLLHFRCTPGAQRNLG